MSLVSDDVLAVWSSSGRNGTRNFEFGLETRTWGFKKFHDDYELPIQWILFGHTHSSGGPRQQPHEWHRGTAGIVLCEVSGRFYTGHAPHWPDETEQNQIIYPCRIGITVVGHAAGVSTDPNGPLGADGSEALRLSGTNGRGIRFSADINRVRQELKTPVTPSGIVDLSRTPGDVIPEPPGRRRSPGQGRSQDPELNAAVEKHAVAMAVAHYRSLGWDEVKPLGKPFDLVCTKVTGEEKHVEVKGTTGAGGDVIYTPNEVQHFRDCPYGADLIVVRDIQVDFTTYPHSTSGGELLHIEDYAAPPEDLKATGWTGRVTGW